MARLKVLNEHRKGLSLRQATTWGMMDTYLMEEHAPCLAAAGHVFPRGDLTGPKNEGHAEAASESGAVGTMRPRAEESESVHVAASSGNEEWRLEVRRVHQLYCR